MDIQLTNKSGNQTEILKNLDEKKLFHTFASEIKSERGSRMLPLLYSR